MQKRGLNWATEIRNALSDFGKEGSFYNVQTVDLEEFKNFLCVRDKETRKNNINDVPKSRSHVLFENEMQ